MKRFNSVLIIHHRRPLPSLDCPPSIIPLLQKGTDRHGHSPSELLLQQTFIIDGSSTSSTRTTYPPLPLVATGPNPSVFHQNTQPVISAFASKSPHFTSFQLYVYRNQSMILTCSTPSFSQITFSSYFHTGVYLRNKFAWGLHVCILHI
jgi:hypothetical protein